MSQDRPPVCDYTDSDYQSSFWDQGGRRYEDQTEEIALRRLLPAKGNLLLELGAGAGRNTPRYHSFERIVLLDYSLTQLQQAQSRLGRHDRYIYVAADIYRLPLAPGLFDAATMIRALHHMVDAPLALRQVRQVLQPGAAFILEFANKHNLKAILRYGMHRQTWNPFTPEPIEFTHLNFNFHPRSVRQWLAGSDFIVERQLTVSHFRVRFLKRLIPLRLLVGMDSILQLTGNWLQVTPSVFVLARAAQEGRAPGTPAEGDQYGQTRSTSTHSDPVSFFRCPDCGQAPLEVQAEALSCPSCGRRWSIRDGIYDFRDKKVET